jgi:hypothetical protein
VEGDVAALAKGTELNSGDAHVGIVVVSRTGYVIAGESKNNMSLVESSELNGRIAPSTLRFD